MISKAELRELLDYDPATGVFTWRARRERPGDEHDTRVWNARYAGKEAGSSTGRYRVIVIHNRPHSAHRLAVLYMTGEWPEYTVDHRDGNGRNNRWRNLRRATWTQNQANRRKNANNTTGFKGVRFDRRRGRYNASICAKGNRRWLGTFDTAEEAHAAYCAAAEQTFGEYARAA